MFTGHHGIMKDGSHSEGFSLCPKGLDCKRKPICPSVPLPGSDLGLDLGQAAARIFGRRCPDLWPTVRIGPRCQNFIMLSGFELPQPGFRPLLPGFRPALPGFRTRFQDLGPGPLPGFRAWCQDVEFWLPRCLSPSTTSSKRLDSQNQYIQSSQNRGS